MAVTLELDDIQGLVARGYGDLRAACFLLLALGDRRAAGTWLGEVRMDVTRARGHREGRALNVAFTPTGLRALGLPEAVIGMFSTEFVEGMTSAQRGRLLGDTGELAPEGWAWGGPTTTPVDAVLMLYALDGATLEALYEAQSRHLQEHDITEILRLDTSDLDGVEPFGFRDGVSQPIVEGLGKTGRAADTVRAGEFILGYRNEYGRYTSRPVLAASSDPGGILPQDTAGSGRADLGRNGSYLVFRQLAQDVAGFWQFVDRAAMSLGGTNGPATRDWLAAKMVGRWPSGAPLVLTPDGEDPSLASANDFGYFHEDAHGLRCPIGAHVRRAHPRDSLDPSPGSPKSIAVGNRHRLLRRGREYAFFAAAGPGDPRQWAASGDGEAEEQGIHFICLNSNLSRQYEFVQHTWINSGTFAGLHGEPDPLISPHGRDEYRLPGYPVRTRLTGLRRFVTVRGGAYFFLPGLRALRYLATRAIGGGP